VADRNYVTRRPVRELVDSVGSADFEPIVAKILRYESIADSHECLLNARFYIEIFRDLNLIAACATLLGHLPVVTLLVSWLSMHNSYPLLVFASRRTLVSMLFWIAAARISSYRSYQSRTIPSVCSAVWFAL
jgi:hypothetical protein